MASKKENELMAQLQKITARKSLHNMTEEEIEQELLDSEFVQMYKSLPKSQRSRLTRKQLLRMGQEKTAAELLQIQVAPQTQAERKRALREQRAGVPFQQPLARNQEVIKKKSK